MAEEHVVYRRIDRVAPRVVEQLRALGTATLTHYLPYENVMASRIHAMLPNSALAGPAITVQNPPRDNLTLHKALEIAQAGDVLVVDSKADTETAVWGGQMAISAKARGLAGMVVDGAVRDVAEIAGLPWPVWAVGANPRGPAKDKFGSINVPIICGGVIVQPGDVVVADADAVVVVPRARAEDVARQGQERVDREAVLAKRLEQGELNANISGYDKTWQQMGIREIDGTWQG